MAENLKERTDYAAEMELQKVALGESRAAGARLSTELGLGWHIPLVGVRETGTCEWTGC